MPKKIELLNSRIRVKNYFNKILDKTKYFHENKLVKKIQNRWGDHLTMVQICLRLWISLSFIQQH
jgi:hypothetical protein